MSETPEEKAERERLARQAAADRLAEANRQLERERRERENRT
jgi:hypothetical protein